jgi:chromosome partitioning protein
MGTIISVINQKGGIGKTTFVLNAAYEIAQHGKKVLIIDNDPQSNATSVLCPDDVEIAHYLHECYGDPKESLLDKIILKSEIFEVDFIPSCILLAEVEISLNTKFGREVYLKKILQPIKDKYDFIIIDCGPSLGVLTANALTAADKFIIATRPEKFALNGIEMVLDTVKIIKEDLNPDLKLAGVCITWMPNTNIAKKHLSSIFDYFKDKLFKVEISCSKDIEEAHTALKPLSKYKECKTAKQYKDLIKEILPCL